jgi:hypothetical protein
MPRTPPADLRLYYLARPAPIIDGLGPLQTYFPSLEVLFPSLVDAPPCNPSLAANELAVHVDASGNAIVENLMTRTKRETPVWLRKTHLVEPVEVMSGEYALPLDGALPAARGPWQRALHKLNDPYNEAYTDAVAACMVSRLVEMGHSPHFARFYGTMNGRVPEYAYNFTDDMPDCEGEAWFRDGLRLSAFRVIAVDPWNPDNRADLTAPWEDVRRKLDAAAEELSISDSDSETGSVVSDSDLSSVDIDDTHTGSTPSATDAGSDADDELEEVDLEITGTAEIVQRPRLRLERVRSSASASASASDSDSGSGSEQSDGDDDVDYFAILRNFPAQITVLERCDGTLDQLMEDEESEDATADMRETKEARWTAWIFQVIAGLAAAQHHYDLIHNDLHTNNVMWCGTGDTHLYYHVKGAVGGDRYYRVPTYGRVMKIIDFGRATFRPPAAGNQNRVWLSDAYAPGADAAGQYNCGAYFEKGQPKVQPNRSFDLCRLAVALFETLWSDTPEVAQPRRILTREIGRVQSETISPLWNLLWIWLTDRQGRNILRSPGGSERYPNFDLYCAIARDSHNAVPAAQLTLPLFDRAFRCRRRDIPSDAHIYGLVAVPGSK